MKVFIGFVNIASQFNDIKQSFKSLGVETFTVSRHAPSAIVNKDTDFNIQKAKDRIGYFKPGRISVKFKPWWDKKVEEYVFKKAIKECDCFIFFWETFYPDHSDLKILKDHNKRIISVFVGDDARWYSAMKQEFEMYKMHPIQYDNDYDHSINGLEQRLSLIRSAEKYSDFIFSRLDQGQLEIKPYYRWNMMVNSENFKNNPEQRRKPVIAHAPSFRSGKGTKYVLEAFKKLKEEGVEFEEILIENVPNHKAIEMYSNADVLIDQLFCPGAGKVSTEAMACGTIVMSNMSYDKYPQNTPSDCPIIDVNPDTLYTKLKELILNYEFRKEHAKKGRPYVEKHLDVSVFCKKVIDLVNGKSLPCEYNPDFFAKHFIPESSESIPVYNKWNAFVKESDWYKKGIPSGERAGLKF
jgi:glycosyltransferase involved in cell wall biosynthesis